MTKTNASTNQLRSVFQDRWLLGIMLLAFLIGLIYNFAILIGFGPDEPRHMNYVKL